jgi:MSHA pilin protein MshC
VQQHAPVKQRNSVFGYCESGFTMVELVVVITIMGILATVAAPRFFDNQAFEERGYFEELVAAARYGQKLAVASGCPVRLQIATGGYALNQQLISAGRCDPGDSSFGQPVLMPSGQTMTGTTPAGIAVGPTVTVIFNALGQTDLGSDQSINVGGWTLQIQADSGYVTIL